MLGASIVTISGDAGGAAALAPVLSRLQSQEAISLRNFAYLQAPAVLEQAGVRFTELESGDLESARQILEREHASVLLTATSVNRLGLEKHFVAAARHAYCPSLGVLDFWSNYAERFADAGGAITCAPDLLAVMDTRAATEVREAGIPSELLITGQPAFDRLGDHRQGFGPATRAEVRGALGALPSDVLVLFVSQALDELYDDAATRIGFNQHEVQRLVTRTLAQLRSDQSIVLAVRRHPRESELPIEGSTDGLKVVRDDTPNRWNAVMAADLVVGMNSVLLLEASYLGTAVLSLQPELRGDDVLPSNRWGGSAAAYRSDDAARLLVEYVSDASPRERLRNKAMAFAPDGNATQRVYDCVQRMTHQARVARE
jgi:hypothetical protein